MFALHRGPRFVMCEECRQIADKQEENDLFQSIRVNEAVKRAVSVFVDPFLGLSKIAGTEVILGKWTVCRVD